MEFNACPGLSWCVELTKCSHSGLHHKYGGAGHHPVVILLRPGGALLSGQGSAGLRVRVRHTERLPALVPLTEEDVALQVDRVGVREPEHRVQLRRRDSSAGVKHELRQNISLRTSAFKKIKTISHWIRQTYPLLFRSLTELFLSLNAKQFLTLMPYFSAIDVLS